MRTTDGFVWAIFNSCRAGRSLAPAARALLALLAAGVACFCCVPPAEAIDIQLVWQTSTASFDRDGWLLRSLADEAERIWEDIFEDPRTVVVTYRYADIGATDLANGTATKVGEGPELGHINVSNHSRGWYFDETPLNHSEYLLEQTLYRDLSGPEQGAWFSNTPPARLEVGYRGTATATAPLAARTGFDMFSTLVHEIGHVLGLSHSLMAYEQVHGDAGFDFDVPGAFNAGNAFGVLADGTNANDVNQWAHLASRLSLMCNGCAEAGLRRLPSATDVFAIASAAGWSSTQIDLPRKEFLSGSDWSQRGNWSGNQIAFVDDEAFVRHGGSVSVTATQGAKSLWIDENSTVALSSAGRLIFDTRVAIADGTLRLQSANSLSTPSGYVEVLGARDNTDYIGRVELAGSISVPNEPLRLRGRNSFNAGEPHLRNVSGNNTWNGPITLYTAAGNYGFESVSGTLTLSSTATIAVGNTTSSRTLRFFGAGNGVANGVIDQGDNTWSVVKSGAGTWTFSGSNSFSGGATISGGTLSGNTIANQGTNSAFGRGNFALSGGGRLRYTGPTASTNRTVALSSGGGEINLTSPTSVLTITGVISGTSGATFTKGGIGSLRLSGANAYAGSTVIADGILLIGANERIPDGSAVSLGALSIFDLSGFTETIGSLSGGGGVTLGAGRLIAGGNGTSTTYSGLISGTGGVTKRGAGTWTLSGASSYGGTTIVEQGEFHLSGAAASIALSAQVNVRTGATLRRSGGDLVQSRPLVVAAGGLVSVAPGLAFRSTGDLTNDGTIAADAVRNEGSLRGNGRILGDLINAGTIVPGGSLGVVTIEGDFSQLAGGAIDLEIGGAPAGLGFDSLSVSGAATLDGELRVRLIDDFVPQPDFAYAVLVAQSVTGAFDDLGPGGRLFTEEGLGSFRIDYEPGGGGGGGATLHQIVLRDFRPIVPLAGDFDGDGVVDGADLNVWKGEYGSATNLASDANGDGRVDGADVMLWQRQLGGGVAATPAPEPGGGVLLGLAVTLAGTVGRRILSRTSCGALGSYATKGRFRFASRLAQGNLAVHAAAEILAPASLRSR